MVNAQSAIMLTFLDRNHSLICPIQEDAGLRTSSSDDAGRCYGNSQVHVCGQRHAGPVSAADAAAVLRQHAVRWSRLPVRPDELHQMWVPEPVYGRDFEHGASNWRRAVRTWGYDGTNQRH